MKELTRVQFFKLAGKVAENSKPHAVSAQWRYNSFHCWTVSVVNDDASEQTHINSQIGDDPIHTLKLAAKNGVVPGEEVK